MGPPAVDARILNSDNFENQGFMAVDVDADADADADEVPHATFGGPYQAPSASASASTPTTTTTVFELVRVWISAWPSGSSSSWGARRAWRPWTRPAC